MKYKWIAIMLVLVPIFLIACQNQEEDPKLPSESSSQTDTAEPTVSPPNVLNDILKAADPSELSAFSYFGVPEIRQGYKGIPFPVNGAGDITYSCGYDSSYAEKQSALALVLAEALNDFSIDESSAEEVLEEMEVPSGDYFCVWPTITNDWSPILFFFDSGEIYLDYNDGMGTPARRWRAADTAQFHSLRETLEEIHAELDALPLDYQVSICLSPSEFLPESEAVRLAVENKGAKPVEYFDSFLIERQTDNGWQPVSGSGEVLLAEGILAVEARSFRRYAVDLMPLENSREPGNYRISGTLKAGEETLPFTLEYEITSDAWEASHYLPPEMTLENQEYCDKYVSMWGFYSPFKESFTEENYLQQFHTYHIFYMMAATEGSIREYENTYGADIPADIVEGVITRHFLVTPEQIRAQTPTKQQNSSEHYDPITNSYHFEGGYGGGGFHAVVSESRQEGDLLILACDWYGMDDGYEFSHELTIRLGEEEHDFVYVANTVTKEPMTY